MKLPVIQKNNSQLLVLPLEGDLLNIELKEGLNSFSVNYLIPRNVSNEDQIKFILGTHKLVSFKKIIEFKGTAHAENTGSIVGGSVLSINTTVLIHTVEETVNTELRPYINVPMEYPDFLRVEYRYNIPLSIISNTDTDTLMVDSLELRDSTAIEKPVIYYEIWCE